MKKGPIVPLLIVLNTAVFLAWYAAASGFFDLSFMIQNFLISYESLAEGRVWTLLTAAFSHNMFFHILVNMIVVHSFGSVIEMTLGSKRFLSFYFIAAVFSSLCHALVSAFILGEPQLQALGASGAAAGVLLLFALIYPKEKILIMGLIPIPALVGALLFIGLDLWGLFAQAGGGGLPIGHGAHLGGALIGIIYYFLLRPRRILG